MPKSKKMFNEAGSYASVKAIRDVVVKEASGVGFGKLVDEINWINNLPKNVKDRFP